jgi:peptide/nickel transport system substrate-binding protein
VAAIQTGDADVVADIPPDLGKRLDGRPEIQQLKVFPFCMQVYVLNTQQGVTKNPLVRQAIDAVVNVDEISAAMGRVSQRNHSLVYSSSAYYQGDAMKAYYDQKNPAKARELLKKAGYNGEQIVLQTNANNTHHRDAILVLSELMKEAGMNVKVDIVDWTTNASNMQRGTGTWNVSSTGFCSNALLGPQAWRSVLYTFTQLKTEPVMDAAYDKIFASPDIKVRAQAWGEIEKRVLDQAYMIKIADLGSLRAFNTKKVEGFTSYYLPVFWNVGLK